jgi:hypothetical protein
MSYKKENTRLSLALHISCTATPQSVNITVYSTSQFACSNMSNSILSWPTYKLCTLLQMGGPTVVAQPLVLVMYYSFSYPEPILRAVNGARQGALAKSISNWHLIGHNEGCCSNTGYILLPCFYGIRLWIWPEPLVAPRVRRALGTRMCIMIIDNPWFIWLLP